MFSKESKLAIKISFSAFAVFVIILSFIIGGSFVYQRDRAIRDFHTEMGIFEQNPEIDTFIARTVNTRNDQ